MRHVSVLAAAIAVTLTGPAVAEAISFKGVCTITAGTIGGKKFATLKCYKKKEPGHYNIRSTVWEKDKKDDYRALIKHVGRRFTCTFTENGFVYLPQQHRNVDMTDCR